MNDKIDKTFVFNIPDDSGDVLVTGQLWADNLNRTIPGWPNHTALYFNFSSEKYPEHPSFVPGETLALLVGPQEDLRIGRHTETGFEEIVEEESMHITFMSHLRVNLLELAVINPETGHFDFTTNRIYPK